MSADIYRWDDLYPDKAKTMLSPAVRSFSNFAAANLGSHRVDILPIFEVSGADHVVLAAIAEDCLMQLIPTENENRTVEELKNSFSFFYLAKMMLGFSCNWGSIEAFFKQKFLPEVAHSIDSICEQCGMNIAQMPYLNEHRSNFERLQEDLTNLSGGLKTRSLVRINLGNIFQERCTTASVNSIVNFAKLQLANIDIDELPIFNTTLGIGLNGSRLVPEPQVLSTISELCMLNIKSPEFKGLQETSKIAILSLYCVTKGMSGMQLLPNFIHKAAQQRFFSKLPKAIKSISRLCKIDLDQYPALPLVVDTLNNICKKMSYQQGDSLEVSEPVFEKTYRADQIIGSSRGCSPTVVNLMQFVKMNLTVEIKLPIFLSEGPDVKALAALAQFCLMLLPEFENNQKINAYAVYFVANAMLGIQIVPNSLQLISPNMASQLPKTIRSLCQKCAISFEVYPALSDLIELVEFSLWQPFEQTETAAPALALKWR